MSADQLFKKYENQLIEFENWVKEHSRLSNSFDKLLLLRFLKVYDFDLDAAKKLLIIFLDTRKKYPHIFHHRDVLAEKFQTAMSTVKCCALPKNTKDNHKISVFYLADRNPDNFSFIDIIRMILVSLDVRLAHIDANELINGEISILDASGYTFKHFAKMLTNFGAMKAFLIYSQEAAPIKIVQSHLINCSPIIRKFLTLVKPFMRKEVWDSFKIHSSMDSLYEFIPKELLPNEYGGSVGSLDNFFKNNKSLIEAKLDYILCDDNWKIKDSECDNGIIEGIRRSASIKGENCDTQL